jgi:hypothetical protein
MLTFTPMRCPFTGIEATTGCRCGHCRPDIWRLHPAAAQTVLPFSIPVNMTSAVTVLPIRTNPYATC